jgi:hypothetical protein
MLWPAGLVILTIAASLSARRKEMISYRTPSSIQGWRGKDRSGAQG